MKSSKIVQTDITRNAVGRLKPAPEFKSLHLRQKGFWGNSKASFFVKKLHPHLSTDAIKILAYLVVCCFTAFRARWQCVSMVIQHNCLATCKALVCTLARLFTSFVHMKTPPSRIICHLRLIGCRSTVPSNLRSVRFFIWLHRNNFLLLYSTSTALCLCHGVTSFPDGAQIFLKWLTNNEICVNIPYMTVEYVTGSSVTIPYIKVGDFARVAYFFVI